MAISIYRYGRRRGMVLEKVKRLGEGDIEYFGLQVIGGHGVIVSVSMAYVLTGC